MKKFYLVASDEGLLETQFTCKLKEREVITEELNEATDILVLGGDGAMLKAIGKFHGAGFPFCGINYGHVGFLMNERKITILEEILEGDTLTVKVRLLEAKLCDQKGNYLRSAFAFNEFNFERTTSQTARLKMQIGDSILFCPLDADGVIVCTSAGSTAYNAAAGGVILPIETEAMVLTGICPAIRHHWRSSILAPSSEIIIEALEIDKRPVRFLADGQEIANATKVKIGFAKDSFAEIKFAKSQNFREKVLRLNFNQEK